MKQAWNVGVHILTAFILIMLSVRVVSLFKLCKQFQS